MKKTTAKRIIYFLEKLKPLLRWKKELNNLILEIKKEFGL
ncbi:unnamed protein product [marine sediment metagenome]|uniref:Uncharacterized protein n=1 Tax=marine sediment metagenome TaxID=412755 RepID=X1M026_9ZZZZ